MRQIRIGEIRTYSRLTRSESSQHEIGIFSSVPLCEIPFFRRIHVSAFNFCMSLFR